MFVGMDRQKQCAFAATVVITNSSDMFNANELEEGASHLVDLGVGIQDVLAIMQTTPGLFKTLTNFNLAKFDELALLVAFIIMCHAQSIDEHHMQVLDLGFALKF